MKKNYILLIFISFLSSSLFAQSYRYIFSNSFAELGGGPSLIDTLTCAATTGSFSSQLINYRSGNCGSQIAYNFNSGEGLVFRNSSSQIGGTYTINMFFKFNSLTGTASTGAQRVITFDTASDNGIYTLPGSGCLQFFSGGTFVGSCPNQPADSFVLVTLVRDSTTKKTDLYLDGALFQTLTDAGGLYAPKSATSPIFFFVDNDTAATYPCEDGPGSVKYISLSPTTSTASQVSSTWLSKCPVSLPLQLVDFHANKQNNSVALSWSTESEVNTSHFELERGSDGNNFNKLVDIPTNNNSSSNTYSYIDNLPLPTGFYRLKLVDLDGTFKYSGILKINFTGIQKLEAFPNPVSNIITVSGINNNELVRLLSADGKVLLQKRASGQTMTIDISAFSSGFYILQYFDGTSIQTLKLVKK